MPMNLSMILVAKSFFYIWLHISNKIGMRTKAFYSLLFNNRKLSMNMNENKFQNNISFHSQTPTVYKYKRVFDRVFINLAALRHTITSAVEQQCDEASNKTAVMDASKRNFCRKLFYPKTLPLLHPKILIQ